MGYQYIIHQMIGIILLHLLVYLFLRINMKAKEIYREMYFFKK